MYKNILITGGSTKISFHLKKLINKKYKIFSPTKKEWNLILNDYNRCLSDNNHSFVNPANSTVNSQLNRIPDSL